MISRKGYYEVLNIQYELIRSHIHRETMFIPFEKLPDGKFKAFMPIRWLNASYINMMKRHWEQFKFLEKPMNLYHSLVTFKDFPTFAYAWRYKTQQQKIWTEEFHNYVKEYDLFIETDSTDLNQSIKIDGMKLKKFFDDYKVRYHILYSGSKGLHFIVPYDEFSHIDMPVFDKDNTRDIVHLFKTLASRLKAVLGCDTLDDSVVDVRRVKKTAYSWDIKSNRIALPLTDEQVENFDLSMVDPVNVLKAGIYKRGLLYRHEAVPKEERQKNINKMFADLDIDLKRFK